MAQKLVELGANWQYKHQLMWSDDDPALVDNYLLHRAPDPVAGPFTQIARIPNRPGSGQDKSNMCGGGRYGRHPRKIYYTVDKPIQTPPGYQEDLTWHYILQREKKGVVLTEDSVIADIIPRTILSFEETHSYFGVQGPSFATAHRTLEITIPAAATTWWPLAASSYVYDILLRHGRPGLRVRFRADGDKVQLKLNNRNNLPQDVPVKVDDYTWDNVYEESYGGVWIYRLLFINTAGVDRTVELDYSHGLQ